MLDLVRKQGSLRGQKQDQPWSLWSVTLEEERHQWPLWQHKRLIEELITLILESGQSKRNEGRFFSHFLFTLVLQKSLKLKAVVVSSRQEKVNLAPTSRPSATSWLTGTTCSSRPPSRPTSRYAPKRCMIISCSTLVCFWFLPNLTAAPCHLSQLSGTDILDTIDSEATGTLKDCYVTLGGCLHGSGCSHKSLTCGWRLCVCVLLSLLQSGVPKTRNFFSPAAWTPPWKGRALTKTLSSASSWAGLRRVCRPPVASF